MERKIVEYLVGGTGVKAIARLLHISRERIRNLREQAKEYGYLRPDGTRGAVSLPPYPEVLFPEPTDGRRMKVSAAHRALTPHRAWIEERLQAGWHSVTVWEELPVQVNRSSFYRYLEREKLNRIGETYRRVIPEIIHQPGEALILDWGKLRDVLDPEIGKKRTLWMFVGVLGFSRYLMERLVWRMDVSTTLNAIESMFREIGGVPAKVTIDNPKCIALEASVYEPLLNPITERFSAHYGVIIEALPPADPQKKGKIERMVPYCRRLYEAHGDDWNGIEESQDYFARKLKIANDRRHGTTLKRPRELFMQEESKALRPLPALSYEIEQFHEGTVRKDGHIRFQNKYYSVDEQYMGKNLVIVGNSKQVTLYHRGKLLEVHPRVTDPHQTKSTKPQHLKPWERSMEDGSVYRRRAGKLGTHVEEMVVRLLRQGQGFIDTRKIWGILSLDKRYTAQKINDACRRALEVESLSYRAVKRILEIEEAGALEISGEPVSGGLSKDNPSRHKHVRPLSVYQAQLSLFKH